MTDNDLKAIEERDAAWPPDSDRPDVPVAVIDRRAILIELRRLRAELAQAKRHALALIDSEVDGMHPDRAPPLVRALCDALGITDEEISTFRFGHPNAAPPWENREDDGT